MLILRAQAKSISPDLWRAIGVGLAVAVLFFVVVGLVTGAIDTPVLERQTPLLAIDYPIWVVNAALLGALSGLSVYARSRHITQGGTAIFSGGFLAAFAVSCPLCNGLLVAAFGAAGVLNVIEPGATVHQRRHHAHPHRAARQALAHVPRRLRRLRSGANGRDGAATALAASASTPVRARSPSLSNAGARGSTLER